MIFYHLLVDIGIIALPGLLQIHSSCILWHGDRSREQDWTRYQKFVLVGSNRELPMAESSPPKARQVSRPKHWHRVYTGVCGHGNTVWICNPLRLFPKEKSGLYSVRTALKYQQAAYWRGVLSATISRMRRSSWKTADSVAGRLPT